MSANHERNFTLSALVLLFSCVLGVLASMPVSAQTQIIQFNPDRDIMRAQTALRRGELDTALKYYQRAARKDLADDHKVVVQNSICAVSYLKGEFSAAEEACTTVIKENPRYWKAYVTRGNAKRKLGDMAGALTDFCEANRLSPDHVKGAFVSRCAS